MPEYSIDSLLRKDGYRRVTADVQVGDVAVYRSGAGDIEHTGIVCSTEPLFTGGTPVPLIWSMWGALGEYVHSERDAPYEGEVEYWRIG